jgi:phage gp29-like protein
VGNTEVGFRKKDTSEFTVQEPQTINKVRIAVLNIILVGFQKIFVPGAWILERILIPNFKSIK